MQISKLVKWVYFSCLITVSISAYSASLDQTVEVIPIQIDGGGAIQHVEISPHDPEFLVACVDVAGIALSRDGGQTWMMSNKGLNRREYFCVADARFAPSKPGWIYAATGRSWGKGSYVGRLFVSQDNGESWEGVSENLSFSGQWVIRQWGKIILVDPNDHLHVIVGTVFQGLLESFDGGKTFQSIGPKNLSIISSVTSMPGNANEIFVTAHDGLKTPGWDDGHNPVGAEVGIWKSSDYGKTWHKLLDACVFDLAISPDGQMLAATEEAVYYSMDRGNVWKTIDVSYKIDNLRYRWWAAGADPRQNGRFIVGAMTSPELFAHPKIYVKENGDERLRPIGGISKDAPFTNEDIATYYTPFGTPGVDGWQGWYNWFGPATTAIVFHPTQNDVVYLADWYTVNRSTDNGKTWKAHHRGLHTTVPIKTVFDALEEGHFYIGLVDVGFHEGWLNDGSFRYRSLRDTVAGTHGSPVQFDYNGDIITFAAVSSYEGDTSIYRKLNRQEAWELVYDNVYKGKRAGSHEVIIEMDKNDGMLMARLVNGTILMSRDLGKTWSRHSDDIITLEMQESGKVRCPRHRAGVWRVNVNGQGYVAKQLGQWEASDAGLWDFAAGDDETVFWFKEDVGPNNFCELLKSEDAGATWKRIYSFYKQQDCGVALTCSPNVLYVFNNPFTGYVLSKTEDGGKTWSAINNVPGYKIQSICPDPRDPHRFVAGSHGLGNYLIQPRNKTTKEN